MKKLSTLILTLFLMGTTALQNPSTKILKLDEKRVIKIAGRIDRSILKQVNELDKLTETNHDPVYIEISSPGGEVFAGIHFLNAMRRAKARGVRLICVVPFYAASMAFQIYANCDERYAFQYSMLLWHPMSITITGGRKKLHETETELKNLEEPLLKELLKALDIPEDVFYYHYYRETVHTAYGLNKLSPNFLRIIDEYTTTGD